MNHSANEPIAAPRIGPKVATAPIVLAALGCWLLLMWLRTSTIPAPNTGDEVWFGESAYWLLQEGVMRSDWHRDVIGSNIRDFFPPIIGLLQAGMFWLLGLNVLAMSIAPSLLVTGIVAVLATLLYTPERPQRMLLALAPFAFPQVYQSALAMRYEICVAFFLMLALACLRRAMSSGFRSPPMHFLFGFGVSVAAISYYQVAVPMLAFGAAVATWVPPVARRWRVVGVVVAGIATPLLLMLWWIHPDYRLFVDASLKLGSSYALDYRITLAWVAVAVAAAVVLFVARQHPEGFAATSEGRAVVLMSVLIGAVLLLQYLKYGRLALISALLAVVAFVFARAHLAQARQSPALPPQGLLDGVGWIFAAGAIALACATAYVGLARDERNYPRFAAELGQAVNKDMIVVADNRAWLALRDELPAGRLIHLLFQDAGPGHVNRSLFLDGRDDSMISTVALRPSHFDLVSRHYPLIDRFLKRDDVEGPIAVGGSGVYQLEVYRLRRAPSQQPPGAP